jgi:hypothetical protein
MAEKHLAEAGWKTLAVRNKVKNDAGLAKALGAYAKLGESGAPEARLEAVGEIAAAASKLKKEKSLAEMEEVIGWLDEVVKEAAAARGALAVRVKSGGGKDTSTEEETEEDDSGDLLAALTRVRNGKGDTVLEFAACAAKPVYGLAVARRITPKHKSELTEATGGKTFLLGTCLFEAGKLTFVMETAKTGLAKHLHNSIKHFTTKSLPVRVRDAASKTVLDSDTDLDSGPESGESAKPVDLEEVKSHLATVIEGIKKAATLKNEAIASILKDATLAASEAGMFVRKSDARGAAALVERASGLLRQALVTAQPKTTERPKRTPKPKEPLPQSTTDGCRAVATSGEKSGYVGAKELDGLLLEAVENCPSLARHLGNTLGGAKRATIVFSDTAKDAFYSKTGDRDKGVPDNVIILPKNGKTPLDLLDGLIFESCNAEIQSDYDDLTKDLFARIRTPTPEKPTLSLLEYGKQKAEIESKAVLKDAQLKFALRDSGVEISYQGQRNLLAMLRVCKETKGGTLEGFDAILDDPVALAKHLAENEDELGEFLKAADSDEEIKKAILSAMATSPHNRNSAKDDKNSLNSDDLYAYELLETLTVPMIVNMVVLEINKVAKLAGPKEKTLRQLIQARVGLYDVVAGDKIDRSARNAVVLRILDDLREFAPALAGCEFATFGFSSDMKAMATTLQSKSQGKNGELFEQGKLQEEMSRKAMMELLAG